MSLWKGLPVILGMAVAMMVLSRAIQKTDKHSARVMTANFKEDGYGISSSPS